MFFICLLTILLIINSEVICVELNAYQFGGDGSAVENGTGSISITQGNLFNFKVIYK